MGPMQVPYGQAHIGKPRQYPYGTQMGFLIMFFSYNKYALMVQLRFIVQGQFSFIKTRIEKHQILYFCKWYSNMGPIWVPRGQGRMGQHICDQYGSNMGQPIWACPDTAHMGPIQACLLGPQSAFLPKLRPSVRCKIKPSFLQERSCFCFDCKCQIR